MDIIVSILIDLAAGVADRAVDDAIASSLFMASYTCFSCLMASYLVVSDLVAEPVAAATEGCYPRS